MQHRLRPQFRLFSGLSGLTGLVALSLSRLACSEPPASTLPGGTGGTVTSSGGVAPTSGGFVNTGGTTSTGGMSTGGANTGGALPSTGGATPSGGATNSSGGASGGSTGGAPMGGQSAGASAQAGMPTSTGGGAAGGAAGSPSSSGGSAGKGSGGSAGKGSGGAPNAGGAANDLCHRLDAANPPRMLTLSGTLSVHDPVVIPADNQFYLFSTGISNPPAGISTRTSRDLLSWQSGPTFANPGWVSQQVPGTTNLWAPDIAYFGGAYHLYYSASTFGSNRSCIGHATRASLASGSWTDHGSVICSNAGTTREDWNAIDPNVVVDEAGTPWMSFGSFWGGIKMIKLDATGARADTQLLSLAARPSAAGALEGPFIIRQCGYYYLFVSFDSCCTSPWNYNMRVGRSTSVTGPYVDKAGTAMMQGGGTLLVTGNGSVQGPGHNAILVTANATYNIYHGLNPSNHAASLRIAQMVWDADGWPVSAGP